MDPSLQTLINDLDTYLNLGKLPDLMVLLVGIVMGLLAKNLYTVVKGMMGFAGSFFGRMFVGWWQDLRRETPNVLDVSMVVPLKIGSRRVLMMDALIGSRKLTDLYLNPRTAFGVRIQAFFVKRDRPWIFFPQPRETWLGRRVRAWRNTRRTRHGLPAVTLTEIRRIKYRRVYQPVESLIGQYLTNEWATAATLGEAVYLFRFIIIIVYEKYADDYIDRQFHALAIWDHVLEAIDGDPYVAVQPEHRHRSETVRRAAQAYRAAGAEASWQFGSLFVAIPCTSLTGTYVEVPVKTSTGEVITIHRPAPDSLDAGDVVRIARAARRSPDHAPAVIADV